MTSTAIDQPIRGNKMSGRQKILDMPRVSVFRNAGLAPGSGVATIVSWDTVEYDVEGMWSANDPTKLKCVSAGLYDVNAWGTWAADATVTRRMLITKTTAAGVTALYFNPGAEIAAVGAGLTTTQQVGFHIPMNAGDYVTLTIQQFTAGGLAFSGATLALRTNGFQACLIST